MGYLVFIFFLKLGQLIIMCIKMNRKREEPEKHSERKAMTAESGLC